MVLHIGVFTVKIIKNQEKSVIEQNCYLKFVNFHKTKLKNSQKMTACVN